MIMFNTFLLIDTLRNAGFDKGAVHPVANDDAVIIRLPGLDESRENMDRVSNVIPMIEACGLTVEGFCTGMTSCHDREIGGSVFARRAA